MCHAYSPYFQNSVVFYIFDSIKIIQISQVNFFIAKPKMLSLIHIYFDFEAYASHLQEHGKFLVTEHGIFELPE